MLRSHKITNKFNIGDVVHIKKPDDTGLYPIWIYDMDRADGIKAVISGIKKEQGEIIYAFDDKRIGGYCFNEKWLSHPDDETITIDGELEIDKRRGVIYFHDSKIGITRLRFKTSPEKIAKFGNDDFIVDFIES